MAMVDHIVSVVLTNVTQLLVRETNLIRGAKDEVVSLQFLRNSEGKRDQVHEVVNQIQIVALEAEDVIDDFVINMAKHKRRSTLLTFWHVWGHSKMLWDVAKEIKGIKKKIEEIYANRDKYNIGRNDFVAASEAVAKQLIYIRRKDVEENEVVSLDIDASSVMKKLDTQDPYPDAVSIIGMGGLGKTTLAKKIYCSNFVKKEFECRAWVDVSQDYNPRALLLRLIESVMFSKEEVDKLTEEELVETVKVALENKRYLIVLDDLWYKHQWDGIKRAFPENRRRSRILITSRDKGVASHAGRTPPYFLPFLNDDDSWELFSKKVFHDELCPPKLEYLTRQEILTRCKGLPLAIVVVAGILANREESMWSKVAAGLSWYLAQGSRECASILALSYHDLPPHLKPCFLYFGVYPEDFEIPVRQLIRLWVAEGFVDQENNKNVDMEDVAEEYLSQLIDRSLIQVASRRTDTGVKSCRIHDLLRDLAISEGIREKFLELHTDVNSPFGVTKSRRLSIHCSSNVLRYTYPKVSQVRSLLFFGHIKNGRALPLEEDPFGIFFNSCRFLKVLDLGSATNGYYPPKVEKLVHLRYLVLKPIHNENLTPITKLINLQTLDIRQSGITRYYNIWEMQWLRHLYLPCSSIASFPKANDSRILPNLRTLSGIDWNENVNREYLMAGRFPNLKKLKVMAGVRRDYVIFECLSKLHCLQTLCIFGTFMFTEPSVLPFSLTKITLLETSLDASAFANLGELPSLQVLKLGKDSLKGRNFECSNCKGHFPRLEVLHMHTLRIGYWKMEGQGLQSLRYVSIFTAFY